MAALNDTTTPGKSPAFQFYANDFVTGTVTLTTEEVGAYMLLMCYCWDKGSIPVDLTSRARIARISPAKMRRAWIALACKFDATADGFTQPRIERERQKQGEYRQRQADASRKRWESHGNPKPHAEPIPVDMPNASSSSSSSVFSLQSSDSGQKKTAPVDLTEARSKRPIFKGQRFVIFEWMLDDLRKMLGSHFDAFDVHSWLFTLDAQAHAANIIVPQRDSGKWLQAQTEAEAIRRGLPVATTKQATGKTAGNASSVARFIAGGSR